MTRRAGWSNLSAGQRARYTRTLGQGNAKQAERLYSRGASLKRARGHDSGAARPAPKPKTPAKTQKRIDELRERTRLDRAVNKISANVSKRRSGKADTGKIREGLSRYSPKELDNIQKMSADDQRRWLRGESGGPAEAAELWYHGSQGWGA